MPGPPTMVAGSTGHLQPRHVDAKKADSGSRGIWGPMSQRGAERHQFECRMARGATVLRVAQARVKMTVVPGRSGVAIQILPPWRSTILRQTASPMPVPTISSSE